MIVSSPLLTQLIVGLVVFLFLGWGNSLSLSSAIFYLRLGSMDEVLKDWQRLSLTEEEGDRVVLDDGHPPNKEFIIAAKFMTQRAVSIDAIGRTFKPL